MEEAGLLKERLQAITDKRRIQEDIANKRRQIEEEKLKLQYIKKKALREQWLMDGLSQQTEEEQEAMRLQAKEEQQQSVVLRTNIDRIEKDIDALEKQELNISANEEVILKRLKEVERTAEDIIKQLKAEFEPDATCQSPLLDNPTTFQQIQLRQNILQQETHNKEPKKAMFAMEISVEHDMKTGQSQVVATATVDTNTLQERGVKVYDDGRKSVYALRPGGPCDHLTPVEVDELLRQARDKMVPSEVQYHQPVYAATYTGTTQSPRPVHTQSHYRQGAQAPTEESLHSQELGKNTSGRQVPRPDPFYSDAMPKDRAQRLEEEPKCMQSLWTISSPAQMYNIEIPQSPPLHVGPRIPPSHTNRFLSNNLVPDLVSVIVRSEGMLTPIQPHCRSVNSHSPSCLSPSCLESEVSFSRGNAILDDLETEPVTMVFMGYQNAEEEQEEDVHAELVIIGNSDDDDDGADRDQTLSYHPGGYTSKVFRPKVGVAKVSSCRDGNEEVFTCYDELVPHKPTFTHKPDKQADASYIYREHIKHWE